LAPIDFSQLLVSAEGLASGKFLQCSDLLKHQINSGELYTTAE